MKISEINLDEAIAPQLEEVEAMIVLENLSPEQAYAYLLLCTPKSVRGQVIPTETSKIEMGAFNALKMCLIEYKKSLKNPERLWTEFVDAKILPGEDVKTYATRLMELLREARPNATIEDQMFFVKPKLIQIVPAVYKPIIASEITNDLRTWVEKIQLYVDSTTSADK